MTFANIDNPKTETYKLRLTKEEKAALVAKADECALPLSQYLLSAGLGRQTRGRADVDAINLLREIADGIKALHGLIGTTHEHLLREALTETVGAIQRVWASEAHRMR